MARPRGLQAMLALAAELIAYQLEAGDLHLQTRPDGSLRLLDQAGREMFTIPAPTVVDARGAPATWTA